MKLCNFCFSVERSFETGLVANWYYKINGAAFSMTQKRIKMYRSLKQFLDDFSSNIKHTDIKFENLSRAFDSFFVILGSVLIVFATIRCLPEVRKRFRIMRLKVWFFLVERSERIKMSVYRVFRAKSRNCLSCACSVTFETD